MTTESKAPHLVQRVERARRVVSHCSQAAIRAYDEEALLAEACRHLIDVGDYFMAWFAESKVGETSLTTLAHAAMESGVRVVQLPWADEVGTRTPTMRALLEQHPQVVRGIPSTPILMKRHPQAKALGYASVCAFPIQFGPHGAGVLTLYAREPDAFAPEEVALLRELAGDMGVALSALRARRSNDLLEERLENAERRFRSIVEHAPVGVLQVGHDGKLLVANQTLADLLGYASPAELMAQGPDELSRHVSLADLQRLRQIVAVGSPYPPLKLHLVRRDGECVWVDIQAQTANGGSEGAVEAFVRDLSAEHAAQSLRVAQERQQQEVLRLNELDRMRTAFMGRASHELNTPLTPILLQVQALSQDSGLNEKQSRAVALIERNVLRLAELVKDLLSASTLESGNAEFKPVDLDVGARIGEAIESFGPQASKAGIRMEPSSNAAVHAFVDGDRLTQVLFNVVGNALKFTPRGGSVAIDARERGDEAVVTVTDTGLGFTAEGRAVLFRPFGRLHEHIKGTPGGTGLGLFISKGLVEASGGTMSAESPGPGLGCTVTFTLPRRAPVSPGRGIVRARGFPDTVARTASRPAVAVRTEKDVAVSDP
ncbi:MAG: hypothetical protein QOC71_676 [Thermoplasmata archaeon]|nr:hypothetical protein [Thermoplasmata archaeon]